MLTRLVDLFARRPRPTMLLWAAVVVVGLVSYLTLLPRDGFPAVDVPVVVVSGTYFVDDQQRVDDEVITPLREAIAQRDDIDQILTFARDSSFSLIVELDEGVKSADAVIDFEQIVAVVALPPEADIDLQSVDAASFFDEFDVLVAVGATDGDADPAALQAVAEDVVAGLEGVEAVERAEVLEALTTGLDPATGQPTTRLTGYNEFTADGAPIRTVVSVGVAAADGVDAIDITDAVEDYLAESTFAGYDAVVAADFAGQINRQIASLQRNVLTGVIAVAIVSFLLISWRASLITAAFILTVMAATMLVLYLVGIPLNTITLFGLILTLGLFVDDAIVIVEAIVAFREPGRSSLDVIRTAIGRVGSASVSGTITTVLVFAPMLFISGVLGDFIRQLPITVMIALTLSLLLSLIFIPTASRLLILRTNGSRGVLNGVEERLARSLAALPGLGARNRWLGFGTALGGVAFSFVLLFAGIQIAGTLEFDIFPPQKDANEIGFEIEFDEGTTIDEAAALARTIDQAVVDELGDLLEDGYLYAGNERFADAQFTLVPYENRTEKAPAIVERLESVVDGFGGARTTVRQFSSGPPEDEFPFQVQLYGEDTEATAELGNDIIAAIDGAVLERPNGTEYTVVETDLALGDVIAREDGRRFIEVRARFDDNDATTLLDSTEEYVADRFDDDELAGRGLEADAIGFDFGQESENSESFSSAITAFFAALVLMFVLLVVQFRSLVQPLLVFLAIPFSFFGVFLGLKITDNPISFFVMLGLIGLIGIAVNNTILLTDFANQERKAGADRRTAIQTAIRRRFRPLVATTLTTVAGLLPLALSDPFWESLSFTIIFGLLSSTLLVVLSFPYYYLGVEAMRDWSKGLVNRVGR